MYIHSFFLLASLFVTALSINGFKTEYHSRGVYSLNSVTQNLLTTVAQQHDSDSDCQTSSEEKTCHRGSGRMTNEPV